ncbi:MAG: nitrous oxide-stimulated promoter family protein [Phycisphaerales bacterium]|nr:MAG: nitrous oxide-stimulated promoter family protein [Phycisphaerales bacterium]
METSPITNKTLRSDLKTLVKFVEVYCRHRHRQAVRADARVKVPHLRALVDSEVDLCPACRKLLAHAVVKRIRCPLDPKPACKRCPSHCYSVPYRGEIRKVMKYSGKRLVLSGRLDYLRHLLF